MRATTTAEAVDDVGEAAMPSSSLLSFSLVFLMTRLTVNDDVVGENAQIAGVVEGIFKSIEKLSLSPPISPRNRESQTTDPHWREITAPTTTLN